MKDAQLSKKQKVELKNTVVEAFRQLANDDEKFRSTLSEHELRMSNLIAVVAKTNDAIESSTKQIAELEATLVQMRGTKTGLAATSTGVLDLQPNENNETPGDEGEKK